MKRFSKKDISKNTVEYEYAPGMFIQMTPEQNEMEQNFLLKWYKEQGEIKRKQKESFESKWASLRMPRQAVC